MYAIKYIRDIIINAQRPTVLERGQSGQCFGAHVNYSLSFMFLADSSGTRCGVLLLHPICFKV